VLSLLALSLLFAWTEGLLTAWPEAAPGARLAGPCAAGLGGNPSTSLPLLLAVLRL